jgi:hypothetical protein
MARFVARTNTSCSTRSRRIGKFHFQVALTRERALLAAANRGFDAQTWELLRGVAFHRGLLEHRDLRERSGL